jgi:LPXTG-site transpeptidase (sortase) family protein
MPKAAHSRRRRQQRRALASALVMLAGAQVGALAATTRTEQRVAVGTQLGEALAGASHIDGRPFRALAAELLGGLDDALPQPEPPPRNAHAETPAVRLGTLEIPKIGLSQGLFEGVTLTSIDRGPSHWPGSAMPGQLGNMVVAGHRVTHTRPFRNLDQVKPGDEMIITTAAGRFVYVNVTTEIVTPNQVDHVVSQSYGYRATTFGCHPPGRAIQRIVARWQLRDAPTSPTR